jgi:outer membrane protein TolC
LEGSDAHWSGLIVARSHDIGIAAALARQREAEARRARADRLPDPTVGVRVLDDLGGRERAVGLVVSIPIGVRQRSATAAAAGADALQAEAELAVVRRDIEHDAVDRVAQMRATHAIWIQRSQALRAAVDSAGKTERAYALGESGLAELLMARRSALEAALAERGAAIDATEALAMVRIDAHDLWHYHEGEGDDEAHNVGAALTLP